MKLTTDRHEASRGLFATAELLVDVGNSRNVTSYRLPIARNLCDVKLERLANTSLSDENMDFHAALAGGEPVRVTRPTTRQ